MKEKRHPRQRKLAKALVKHDFHAEKAYAEAYPNQSKSSVKAHAHKVLKEYPAIKEEAITLLENSLKKEGMCLPKLSRELKGIIDNPVVERQTQSGDVISLKDNSLKLKAVSKAFDLHLSTRANQPTGNTTNIQVNITDGTPDKLDGILSKLNVISRKLGTNADEQDGEIVDVEAEPID